MAVCYRRCKTAALTIISSVLLIVSCSPVYGAEAVIAGDSQLETLTPSELRAIIISLERDITAQANHLSEISARLYMVEQRMHDLEESHTVLRRENLALQTELLRLKQSAGSVDVNNGSGLRWWFVALAVAWGLSSI